MGAKPRSPLREREQGMLRSHHAEVKRLSMLDNTVWNALTTIHASFAEGNELAKRYPVDVAPFAATRDQCCLHPSREPGPRIRQLPCLSSHPEDHSKR